MLAGEPPLAPLRVRAAAPQTRKAAKGAPAPDFEHVGLLAREHVLGKVGAEPRKPLDNLAEALFRIRVEGGASPPEARLITLEHARLLRAEAERLTPTPERVDPAEQGGVEADLVGIGGEAGPG